MKYYTEDNSIYVEEKGSECIVIQDGKVIRIFRGETALMNANRLANDLFVKKQQEPNYNTHLGWL